MSVLYDYMIVSKLWFSSWVRSDRVESQSKNSIDPRTNLKSTGLQFLDLKRVVSMVESNQPVPIKSSWLGSRVPRVFCIPLLISHISKLTMYVARKHH